MPAERPPALRVVLEEPISEKGQLFALRVLEYMRERLVAFQEETGNNYNLEATPAEGTSYRLARLDAEQFPDIQSANLEGGKPFYTNSSQLPVHYSDDPFEVLDLQDELQTRYTFSICPNHGYLAGRQDRCPTCGSAAEVYSRVVGYLRPVNQWNEGKVEEFKQRKTFKIGREAPAERTQGVLRSLGAPAQPVEEVPRA